MVFAREDGPLIDPSADLREWSAILAQAGIPHAGTHTMRHSAATIALDEGVALAVVQEMLGHVPSLLAQDAAARVGRALFGDCYEQNYERPLSIRLSGRSRWSGWSRLSESNR